LSEIQIYLGTLDFFSGTSSCLLFVSLHLLIYWSKKQRAAKREWGHRPRKGTAAHSSSHLPKTLKSKLQQTPAPFSLMGGARGHPSKEDGMERGEKSHSLKTPDRHLGQAC
jgi:hypothetical protein